MKALVPNLTSLTLHEIQLQLREPFRISSGASWQRRVLLIELHDDGREAGWGECVAGETPHYSPETVDTAWHAIRHWIAPAVLGRPWEAPTELHHLLEAGIRGHPMARAAVEMAAWELAARRCGAPLAELLGGVRNEVAAGISLGIQESPDVLAGQAADAAARGYRRIKLKVQPGADEAYVEAVRMAVGDSTPLSVDANAAYTLRDSETLRSLDRFGLQMIEQPLAADALTQHAQLQRQLDTPVCLDEAIWSLARAEEMIALEAGKIINIKPGRVGGFTAAIAIHDLAAEYGVPVWCGGMLESGIGRAHNVALASLPNFTLPGDLSPSDRYWERDIVEPSWTMRDGMIAVPQDRPGMGVELDLDYIRELTVRSETLEA
jgi:O-succinylbenzoate synthase